MWKVIADLSNVSDSVFPGFGESAPVVRFPCDLNSAVPLSIPLPNLERIWSWTMM